ncbi:MAG TPA: DNA polymerase III subunit alpha [Armatimonadota bacterium]|nr:DNA polymerase III subunit alpha [Armatimonadota bacterium]
MLPLLDHALDYLSHGYSVIPCNPKTKKPFVKWKPYQTRLPTEGEVCEWWRQWPNAAIGVVTGKVSRLVVLDADVDKHGANVWLLHQCAPTERIVKTGGGYHLWLRYPEGADFVPTLAGVMEKELGPGLDVRGDGGYVIAPPSLHPSGVLYAWVQEGEATALPPAILESLLEQHRHNPQSVTARVDQDDTQTLSDDEQWLTRSLGGVASGSRNQTLTRLAGYLAGKGLPFDVTERLVEVWDDRNDPPLRAEDEAGFRRTLRSVYEREAAKKAAADHAPGGALDFTLIPLDEFMCEYGDSRVQWIVQEWLPWATTGLIISPPAHYKTWFLLDLAVSIASGRPFLGQFPVEKPGPVILFQQEDAFQGLAGRVLGLPVGLVDKISKGVPFNGTVDDAYETAVAETPQGRFLLNTASDLEGLARNAGVHAAGVVISALPLTEVVPLMRNTESSVPTTQYDWRSVERVGLLKMDFLGLNHLTVVDVCLRAIEETTGLRLTLEEVPAGDESTYALLCAGETTGIFQLESDGMRKLIRSLRPREFADLIALVALYRPGPLGSGMADDFVNRKHGRAAITYLTPALEPILARTYGIIVYQEQVMRIAMDLAGFDPINAEGLLKGMGKKLPEVMAKYRGLFVVGAVERSIPGETAARLYDLMAYFAGYGFNASHAAAYALLAYQTAWLKRHYPAHYFLGLLEAHAGDAEKVALYVAEARRVGIPVLPPDVNTSGPAFQLEPDGDRWSILAGLNGVDRVGDGGVQQVIEGRQHGPYRGLLDFCARITDARKLNSAAIASLISCGAFDWTGQERKVLVDALDDVLYLATKLRKQHPPDEIARMDLPAPQPRQRRVKAVEEPALPQPPAETQGQHVFVTVGEGFIGSPAHASLQLTAARHPGRYPLVVSDGKQYEVGPAVEPTQALLARARAISGGAVEVRVGHADDGSAGEPEER